MKNLVNCKEYDGYFKEDLETLKQNIKEIKNGSFLRKTTINYCLNMRVAYNTLSEFAVVLMASNDEVNKANLIEVSEKLVNEDVKEIQMQLISILDIN